MGHEQRVSRVGIYVELAAGIGVAERNKGRITVVGDDGIVFQLMMGPNHTKELPPPRFYAWSVVRRVAPLEDVPDQGPGMAMLGDE